MRSHLKIWRFKDHSVKSIDILFFRKIKSKYSIQKYQLSKDMIEWKKIRFDVHEPFLKMAKLISKSIEIHISRINITKTKGAQKTNYLNVSVSTLWMYAHVFFAIVFRFFAHQRKHVFAEMFIVECLLFGSSTGTYQIYSLLPNLSCINQLMNILPLSKYLGAAAIRALEFRHMTTSQYYIWMPLLLVSMMWNR